MEITYNLTREDYWQFYLFLMKRKRSYRTAPIVMASIVATVLVIVGLNFDDPPIPPWLIAVTSAGCAAFAAVGLIVHRRYILRRCVRRLPADDGTFLGEHTLRIGPEGIYGKSATSEGSFRWDGVREFAENELYFYLFVDTQMAMIVPKHVFANSAASNEFIGTARSHWEASRKPSAV